jgi:hypothetical protein
VFVNLMPIYGSDTREEQKKMGGSVQESELAVLMLTAA